VPQEEVTRYYWSSAVNWVPYDLNHPFNQAACPTKIMDSLGSGRPTTGSAWRRHPIPSPRLSATLLPPTTHPAIGLRLRLLPNTRGRIGPHNC
jgi:hypothetical protein